MSLISDTPFSNVTTYRADYTKKTAKRPELMGIKQEFKNTVSGPIEECILPYCKFNPLLPDPGDYPEPKDYTDSVRKRRNIKDELDFDLIDRLYENEGRSEYMVAYSRLGDFESKTSLKRRIRPIPEGWEVPETVYRNGYRNPKVLSGGKLPEIEIRRPTDSLKPNEKIREILQVKTGDSEYMGVIGKAGEEIIVGKMHGDVDMRPQFSQDELLRAMLIRRD